MLSPKQQAFELIEKSQNILITLPQNYSADSVASGLALLELFKQLDKKSELVAPGILPQKLSFLPGAEQIKQEPSSLRDFIISIDTSQKKIKQLRYETKDSVLKIYLGGPDHLEQKDIKLEPGPFVYNLIIVLDAPDLETVGQLYEKYTELFFQKPILNIDHKSGNERFGEINLVEPTASSSGEILADFFNSYYPNRVSETIATLLLSAIIDETHSFQKPNTTPQTFNLASLLMAQGAEKEKIVERLYKTKPLNFLKLWGKVLANLNFQPEKNIAWATIFPEDLLETQTTQQDIPAISDEIQDVLPQVKASVILWPQPDQTMALLQSLRMDLIQKIKLELGGSQRNHQILLKFDGLDIQEAISRLEVLLE